jgi:hypothetical protein
MALNAEVSFTWLGHGTWKARSAKSMELVGTGVEVLDIKPRDTV